MCRRNEAYAMYYLTETDPRGAMGLAARKRTASDRCGVLSDGDRL